MLRQWCAEQPDPASTAQYLNEIHPLGYCPEGDAIADACVFLLSDKARFITGHLMHISGGAELGYRPDPIDFMIKKFPPATLAIPSATAMGSDAIHRDPI